MTCLPVHTEYINSYDMFTHVNRIHSCHVSIHLQKLGLCDAATELGEKMVELQPATYQQEEPLLGTDHCTWGPSYWCDNIDNAKKCNVRTRPFFLSHNSHHSRLAVVDYIGYKLFQSRSFSATCASSIKFLK